MVRADDESATPLRARRARGRPQRALRGRVQLETRLSELFGVSAVPDDSSGAFAQAAVPERRQRLDRGAVPRWLHGDRHAARECNDQWARLRTAVDPGLAGERSAPRV